jgi:RimJ/RimL family protein N-acetyltransferase
VTTVRRGTPQDFEVVRDLYQSVVAEGRWLGAESPVRWTADREAAWRRVAGDDSLGAWFLSDDGPRLVGFLSVRRTEDHAEFAMAVAEGSRGLGIGGSLLDAAIAWCRSAGVVKLSCEVWPHNEAAIALYLSRGLSIEGRLVRHWRRRNGELWDSVVMALVLDTQSPGSALPDAPSLSRDLS